MSAHPDSPPPPNLSELIGWVQARTNIAESKRRAQLVALRFHGRVMGRIAPESIRIEPKASVDVMERASADALGVGDAVHRARG